MFDDFDGVCCRSWNSAGKVAIRTPLCGRSIKSAKIPEVPIFPDDGRSQKDKLGWATVGPDMAQARAPSWPRLGHVWPPWPTSDEDLSRISSSREPKVEESHAEVFRRRYEAEKHQTEKSSPADGICRGKLLPGGGDRRHRHRHHAGLHQDHHHHHLHHYFISDPEPYDVS